MTEFAGKNLLLIVENNAVPFDRRVWRQALSLRDAGATVSVICPVFGNDSEPRVVLDGITIYRYRLKFSGGTVAGYFQEYLLAFLKTFWLFHRVLFRTGRINVVHVANPPDIFWPLAVYVRLLGTRFIFDEHDLTPEAFLSRFEKTEEEGGKLFRILKFMQTLSYRVATAVISTNESYREIAIAADRRNTAKTFVVRNGPDTRKFAVRCANPALKKGRRYMAAYIGVMAIQDGVDYVVRAVDLLVHQRGFTDFIVYLIGIGDDWPRLKQMSHDRGVDDYIVFAGRIPDEPALEILSTADVCLSPDPFSPLNNLSTMNKVMEYMALGKPMVSFDLKEARFSAQDSALYVANNSVEAFADGLVKLFEDPVGAVAMGARGKKRIEDQLCWQKQSENLLDVYRFVLNGQRPAPTER